MSETRQSVERRLSKRRKLLALLEEQIAGYTALEAPVSKLAERDQLREEIAKLEALLESGEFPEADEGTTSEQERSADVISATISGDVSGQVAVGKGIIQTQTVGVARPQMTEADGSAAPVLSRAEGLAEALAELQQVLADLRAKVAAEAPPDKKDAALERVGELEEAITGGELDLTTIEYVKRWFVKNLPGLAGAVTSVVGHPIVGKLVEAKEREIIDPLRITG